MYVSRKDSPSVDEKSNIIYEGVCGSETIIGSFRFRNASVSFLRDLPRAEEAAFVSALVPFTCTSSLQLLTYMF